MSGSRSLLDPTYNDDVRRDTMAPRKPKTPREKPEQRVNVWLHLEQIEKLKELAQLEDRSVSSMIRRLIQAGFDAYEQSRKWK